MKSSGYESVSVDDARTVVDKGTRTFATVVSVVSCAVSVAAIVFVVYSIKFN